MAVQSVKELIVYGKAYQQAMAFFKISKRFPPDFDQTTDIVVYYELKSAQDGRDSVYINYENGVFSRGKPQDSSSSAVRVKVPY